MIYVRIELWPGGDRASSRVLGEGAISNVGGTPTVGNYRFLLSKFGGFKGSLERGKIAKSSVWRRGSLDGFRRKQGGGWDLLGILLRESLGNRLDRFLKRGRG